MAHRLQYSHQAADSLMISSLTGKAMEIYRDNISDNSILGIQQGVLNTRNVKQVETIVLKVSEQKRISKDYLYNLVLFISLPYDIAKH
jgi:hypothetical protein